MMNLRRKNQKIMQVKNIENKNINIKNYEIRKTKGLRILWAEVS